MANGENLIDGLEKLTGILTGAALEIDNLAESLDTSDQELAEVNEGKTEEEIDQEDALAAAIAAPLVNALDSMSAILNGATEKIMDLMAEEEDE